MLEISYALLPPWCTSVQAGPQESRLAVQYSSGSLARVGWCGSWANEAERGSSGTPLSSAMAWSLSV